MKISILTATYNAESTLPALIECLRQQTDRTFEWVVVDGGSTDNTVELLRGAGDVVTRWVSEPDFGIYHALNKGLAMVRNEYYVVAGSDDAFEPDAIASFARAAAESGADVIAAPVRVDGAVVQPRTTLSWLRSGPPMVAAHSVGTLIRRALHDEIGPYSRRFPIAADTHFLLRAIQRRKRFVRIPNVVGRFGTDGASSADPLGALSESWRANVEVRGGYWLQLPLFVLRLLANGSRIAAGPRRRQGR
jgi:glycosyltransferase involved in cell wall biosynthesis